MSPGPGKGQAREAARRGTSGSLRESRRGEAAGSRRTDSSGRRTRFQWDARQWQWGRAASLRDQEGWRVNYYTCSQYLTGPMPCPSALHPDSTEGRAKNIAIVSPAQNMYLKNGLLQLQGNVINEAPGGLFPLNFSFQLWKSWLCVPNMRSRRDPPPLILPFRHKRSMTGAGVWRGETLTEWNTLWSTSTGGSRLRTASVPAQKRKLNP